MGEDFCDAAQFVRTFTQKVVMDANNDFAAGFQCGYRQQVQSASDRAFGRVFNRCDQIIRLPRFDLAETLVYGLKCGGMGGMAEMLDGCLLGKRSLRTEVGNRQWTLQRQAFAHYFAKQSCDGLVRQRALVQTLNPP